MTHPPDNNDGRGKDAEAQPAPSPQVRILQALAQMLEDGSGERVTIARLARQVGVSEAALYRHFPSKARMFEGLIEFIEETLFVRINRIFANESAAIVRCEKILTLFLTFCDRNPGIARLLTGDALTGEDEALRRRVAQIFKRLESQIKQALREASTREHQEAALPAPMMAALLMSVCEGRLLRFTRSGFEDSPLADWERQWEFLSRQLLRGSVSGSSGQPGGHGP